MKPLLWLKLVVWLSDWLTSSSYSCCCCPAKYIEVWHRLLAGPRPTPISSRSFSVGNSAFQDSLYFSSSVSHVAIAMITSPPTGNRSLTVMVKIDCTIQVFDPLSNSVSLGECESVWLMLSPFDDWSSESLVRPMYIIVTIVSGGGNCGRLP